MGTDFSQIGPFVIAALVVFVIYRRLRRSFGQQLVKPVRMQIRIALLLIIGCFLAPVTLRSAAFASAVLGGLASGVALALWGAARTRYLRIAGKLYYVPHTYTGIAVSLLFLGRLVYRLLQVYDAQNAHGAGPGGADQAFAPAAMVRSPLTVALFFVLVGYYVCYYSAVLLKSKQALPEETGSDPAAPIT
jgi:hypothetical protein